MEINVLVVEDEPQIRQIYEDGFSNAGYAVQVAESAESAVDMLRTSQASVFFLDLNLPGMDGVELCRKIHAQNPTAVIYAVTGYNFLFGLPECRSAGFEDYFVKPVRMSTLLDAAEHAFSKQHRWQRR